MENNESLNLAKERTLLARERTLLARERTRFSAERTLSSWIRTGLASVGGGFAIIRLLVFQAISHRIMANIIGEILIVWGIVILVLSLIDYRKSCKKFKQRLVKTSEPWITITVFVFVLVSLFLFFVTIN